MIRRLLWMTILLSACSRESEKTHENILTTNRQQSAAYLNSVFSPDESMAPSVFKNIYSQYRYFGGACNPGEDEFCQSHRLDPNESSHSTTREGYRLHACKDLSWTVNSRDAALKKAGLTTLSKIQPDNVQKLFRLFYPRESIDAKKLRSTLGFLETTETKTNRAEAWSRCLMLLCSSTSWEVL